MAFLLLRRFARLPSSLSLPSARPLSSFSSDPVSSFLSLLRQRPIPVIPTNQILAHLCAIQNPDVSVGLFVFARNSYPSYKPSIVTFNILIKAFVHLRAFHCALSVISAIFKLGHQPNPVNFAELLKALCDSRLSRESLGLLRLRLIEADLVIFGTVIDGLCKEGLPWQASRLFFEMKVTADAPIFASLMQGFCLINMHRRALLWFRRMLAGGIYPTVSALTVLVDGFCSKKGHMVTAEAMLAHLLKLGLSPSTVTVTSMISGYIMAKKFEDAIQTFRKMKQAPDQFCCQVTIRALVKMNQPYEGMELAREMRARRMVPDEMAYNLLLKKFLNLGQFDAAGQVIRNIVSDHNIMAVDRLVEQLFMRHFHAAVSIQLFGNIIDSLLDKGHDEEAAVVVKRMWLKRLF